MTPEECPNCKEQVLFFEKAIDRKIGNKTLMFCSQACANAYNETRKTHEDIVRENERQKRAI